MLGYFDANINSGWAISNVARWCRRPAAPILPKTGWAIAHPPLTPLSLITISNFYCIQVHDIAFAPNVGRSYFILGVATNKDLRIISIKNTEDGTKSDQSSKYTVRFTSIAGIFSPLDLLFGTLNKCLLS